MAHVDSYYAATANTDLSLPRLEETVHTDVCIIGGGYTGLSTALHLSQLNIKVALLEAEQIGWGASGRNGGHVGVGQRADQEKLEKLLGFTHARQLWDLGVEAVHLVRELVNKHQIDCDIKSGGLYAISKASQVEDIKAYVDLLNDRYNYGPVKFLTKDETAAVLGTEKYHGAIYYDETAHLHPLNYALGLGNAAKNSGAALFENSKVLGYECNEKIVVRTDTGRVIADKLVLACNGYLEKLEPDIAVKIMPINNFVLATAPLGDALAHSLIRNDACVHDSLFVLNYWKISGDGRLIFGGGENYTRKYPGNIKKFVRKYMLRVYPQLEDVRIDYAWGGTLAVTINRMPHFGMLNDNIFYAHGYSGHGVPIATLAGKLLSEAISGESERFEIMAKVPAKTFPGGVLLRWPGLVAGMLWHTMLDKF